MSERTDVKLMRACAKYILGESTGVRLKGRPETMESLQEVLLASRELYSALKQRRPLREVRNLIERKRQAAEKFKSATGLVWRL